MSQFFKVISTLAIISMLVIPPAQEGYALIEQGEAITPPGKSFKVSPGQAKKIEFNGASLDLQAGSVNTDVSITMVELTNEDLPALDQGMVNATAGPRSGYRMLPHSKFNKKITIGLPYDPALIPEGLTENDLQTFFFDEQTGTWQELERVNVDTQQKMVISLSDHFTDFINATITVPDHPETLAYNPNTIQGIKVADPSAGINLIEPPQGNPMGSANLSYPIEVPAGRGGMQPQLSIDYNSSGGNGWMGMGWDLAIPSISIDTRWGVPRYDQGMETETYLLNGEMLTPVAHRGVLQARSSEKVFQARVEGQFRQIIRHASSPDKYWWEVIEKTGNRSFYGGVPVNGVDPGAVLSDPAQPNNIFTWMLRETVDLNGNSIRYNYTAVREGENEAEPWRQIYLDNIIYTGTEGEDDWRYKIEFSSEDGRPDLTIDGRAGFKTVMSRRLKAVDIWLRTDTQTRIRRYEFEYKNGQFGKSLLSKITQFGEDGTSELAHHDFEYFDEVAVAAGNNQINAFSSTATFSGAHICTDKDLMLLGRKSTALGCDVTKTHQEQANAGVSLVGVAGIAGVSQSYSYGNTVTNLSLLDLNGDGLPDQVFEKDDKLYYRANTGNSNPALRFGQAVLIALPRLPHETSQTLTVGGNVAGGFVSGEAAWTWNDADVYFNDVNGDLLPDLVLAGSNGTVLFNRLVNGVPTFLQDNPVPMVSEMNANREGMVTRQPKIREDETRNKKNGARNYLQGTLDLLAPEAPANTEGVAGQTPPIMGENTKVKTYLVDPLRRWVAPYSGIIGISGEVHLLEQGYGTADGVRVSIQHNETEIWTRSISNPTDLEPYMILGLEEISVNAGDRIYFRVNSRNDGSSDAVEFNPTITYVGVDTTAVDENGRPLFVYNAKSDYAYGARPMLFTAPFNGKATLFGKLIKQAKTTDEVVLEVRKGKDLEVIYQKALAPDSTGEFPVTVDLETKTGDTLQLWIETDSRIDMAGISFLARLSYTEVNGAEVLLVDGQPALFYNLAGSSRIYPRNTSTTAYIPYVANRSGNLKVQWTVEKTGSTPGTYTNAVTLTVKGAGERQAKQRVNFVNGSIDGTATLEAKIPVEQGDQLYFTADATDEGQAEVFASNVKILPPNLAYEKEGNDESVPSPEFSIHLAISSEEAFGGGYRQWSYGQYNGQEGELPIDESRLRLPTSEDDPVVDQFLMMGPFVELNGIDHWRVLDSECWISPDSMSASRLGSNFIEISPNSGGNRGVVRKGRSKSIGGQMSLQVVGGGYTWSTNWSDIDFLDFNGDSYPDVVGDGKVLATLPNGALDQKAYIMGELERVRESKSETLNLSLGPTMTLQKSNAEGKLKGSSTSNKSVSLGFGVSGSWGDYKGQSDLIDMNGDGLPDLVRPDKAGFIVQLNLGYHFGAKEVWGIPREDLREIRREKSLLTGLSANIGVDLGVFNIGGGVSDSESTTATMQDLIDMNGDGLPDIVFKDVKNEGISISSNSDQLVVYLNTGNGFEGTPVYFNGAMRRPMNSQRTFSRSASVQAGVSIPLGIISIDIGGGYSYDASLGGSTVQLTDFNGDGITDEVYSDTNGVVEFNLNNYGKTNLLKTVKRPLGAVITLDYTRYGNTTDYPQSQWAMSSLSVYDGQPNDGTDTQLTKFTYKEGFYNRIERDFYGFQTLIAEERDAGNKEAIYRVSVSDFLNDSYYTKGLPLRQVVKDGSGARFVETENSYALRDVNTKQMASDAQSTIATLFPMLVRTSQHFYEGRPQPGKTTYTSMAYDELGNVTDFFDAGDTGSGDDVSASIEYSACTDIYVVNIPVRLEVNSNGTLLRHREATVDCTTGDVRQVRQYLADGSAAITNLAYYPNGNLKELTGPANLHGQRYKLSYEYDPVVQTYVTKVTDSFGYSSMATYNYKYGAVESTTDINGNPIVYILDGFGRIASVTGPYEQSGGIPTIQFEYYPEAEVPWALSRHLDTFRNPADPIDTALFIDGLKRVLQTKKDGDVFSGADSKAEEVMVVSGRVKFDLAGRVVEQYYPITEKRGKAGKFNPEYDSMEPTRTEFDILDRQTLITAPDHTKTKNSYGFGTDRNGARQFETTTTDANGVQRKSYQNVRNLVVSQEQFNAAGSQIVWTSYDYNPLQQLTEVTDDQGNTTRVSYDNLGRQTAIESPDAGKTESLYDLASNVVSKATANLRAAGKQISYDYEFNRLKSIAYPNNPGNNVSYTYGVPGAADNRAGRIVQVTSQAGTAELFYGKLGEVIKEIKNVATFVPGNQAAYTTSYLYDTWGRLQEMVYPDGEVLTYGYNSGGYLSQASGSKNNFSYDYVRRLEYDKFGQIVFTETGNNVRTQYTYKADNRRLESLQAGKGGGSLFQNLNYSYDNVGNVTRLANDVRIGPASKFGGPSVQTFGYDDLYRLVEAAGEYQFAPEKTDRYRLRLSYDSLNNILSKQQIHEMVQPSGKTIPKQKTSYDWNYTYSGTGPHAATHIGERTFRYDANGNQLGWANDLNGTRRTISWDEENRIQSISDNGQEMTYKYDSAGERVIKRGPQGETVTVNQYYTVRNGRIGTKHVYAGTARMASKLVKSNAHEKDQYFYHPDQLGSSNHVTDMNGQVYEHMEYFPFGETWVEESSNTQSTPYHYTGKELDEETGLYYYGARYYDPRTSAWQSPDPGLAGYLSNPSSGEVYSPANLSVYAYAQQNPVKYLDPDGWKIQLSSTCSVKFRIQFYMARDYLIGKGKSDTARQAWNALEASPEVVEVEEIGGGADSYDTDFTAFRKIHWDSLSGLKVAGGVQSAALGLIHEIGHALQHAIHPDEYKDPENGKVTDPNLGDKEEQRNLIFETKVAGELHEPTRATYGAEEGVQTMTSPSASINWFSSFASKLRKTPKKSP